MKIWLLSSLILIQTNNLIGAVQAQTTIINETSTEVIEQQTLLPFSAKYTAFRSGRDIGDAGLKLTQLADNQYQLTYYSDVSRFFLSDKRHEQTLFSQKNNNFIPQQYRYERTGTGPNKKLNVRFDYDTNKILINNQTTMDYNGELDNQLFRIDLPRKLAKGVTKTSYDFINYRGDKRHYELEVVNSESIVLPFGNIEAIKVKINRESKSRVTYAWFAPSLGYNLVRLQQFKDEKEQGDMQLSSFSYL